MKRQLAIGLFVAIFLASLSGCNSFDLQRHISQTIEIDVSEGQMITGIDTHGGFHGDEELYSVLQFHDESTLK